MNNQSPLRGEILTPKEVQDKLKVSLKTVYKMKDDGEIPSMKIRGCVRFSSADVDDYIFFSKYFNRTGNLVLSKIDKEQILSRIKNEVDHAVSYVEKIFERKEAL